MTTAAQPSGSDRIAVTVVGGYLGSGKTTLVNHILREADERIVVLVNDFGDINIDVDLITARSEDTLELANGCICCSLVDGFAAALDTITALDPRPERLVIEASGVSDPAQVAAWGHGPGLAMDAIVVLVDAETIRTQIDDKYVGQTIAQQLAAADILVVNKIDLIDDGAVPDLVGWAEARCPQAWVTTAELSRVAPEVIFGRTGSRTEGPGPAEHPDHLHHAADVFTTSTIELDEPMTRDAVAELMDSMSSRVVRAKGFVRLADEPDRPAVLQRVGKRWTLRPMGGWAEDPETRIVVIESR